MPKHLAQRTSLAHRGVTTAIDHTPDSLDAFLERQVERCRVKARRGFVRCRQRQLLAASDITGMEQRGYTYGGAKGGVRPEGTIERLADAAIKD